jgi:hypothetical protein
MKDREVLYANGSGDEHLTPAYAVAPIIKYIPQDAIIWCPFDLPSSNFVIEIGKTHQVVSSHISAGQDYYSYEPEHWDIMVSNPPFTKKRKIFERALSFNKPFALLMSMTWLNDNAPVKLFENRDLQLLMLDKRIHFINADGTVNDRPTFACGYYCVDLLPKQIIMGKLEKAIC